MHLTGEQVRSINDLSDGTPVLVYPRHNGRRQQGLTYNVFTPLRFVRTEDGLNGIITEDGTFTEKATKRSPGHSVKE